MKELALRLLSGMIVVIPSLWLAAAGQQGEKKSRQVSFAHDVFPVVKKYCLPCHAQESFNRSELSLDDYELMMEGGKHGPAVIPGKPAESHLIQKLTDPPPFGDQMPPPRRQRTAQPPKRLTEEEIRILSEWIAQGALKN